MKAKMFATGRDNQAFTQVEWLVVIFLIVILVALVPGTGRPPKIQALKKVTQTEAVSLVAAINQYYATYGHLPVSTNAMMAAGTNDFTFGTISNTPAGFGRLSALAIDTPGEKKYQNYNSEIISILRDDNFWPEVTGTRQHLYNPQQTPFFNAQSAANTNSPGIGPDDVLRDAWDSPYIITLDFNGDGKCYDHILDLLYRRNSPTPASHLFVPGKVIVWSLGPSKTIDFNKSLDKNTIVTSF